MFYFLIIHIMYLFTLKILLSIAKSVVFINQSLVVHDSCVFYTFFLNQIYFYHYELIRCVFDRIDEICDFGNNVRKC